MNLQNYLRNEVKRLKWEKNINYKTIAEDLLKMNYNSFINWIHNYKNLGIKKAKILKEFINTVK